MEKRLFQSNKAKSSGLQNYCKNCRNKVSKGNILSTELMKRILKGKVKVIARQCTRCRLIKYMDDFSYTKGGKLGKRSYCKSCASKYFRKYYNGSLEKQHERNRQWRRRFPEKQKNADRNWLKNHPEVIAQRNAKRKEYGFRVINTRFTNGLHAHHLWVERNDFVIYLPRFLHAPWLNYHDHRIEDTMTSINAVALDFWINENLYEDLYNLK